MQLGRGDAGRVRDGVDIGLLAPMLGNVGDGAPHDVVVGSRNGERRQIRNAIGGKHGGLHHLTSI